MGDSFHHSRDESGGLQRDDLARQRFRGSVMISTGKVSTYSDPRWRPLPFSLVTLHGQELAEPKMKLYSYGGRLLALALGDSANGLREDRGCARVFAELAILDSKLRGANDVFCGCK
jgi:hypothetical protein